MVNFTKERGEAALKGELFLSACKALNNVDTTRWREGCCDSCNEKVTRFEFILNSFVESLGYMNKRMEPTRFDFPLWVFSDLTFNDCDIKRRIYPKSCIHVHTYPAWQYLPNAHTRAIPNYHNARIVQILIPAGTPLYFHNTLSIHGYKAAIAFVESFQVKTVEEYDYGFVLTVYDVETFRDEDDLFLAGTSRTT
jgi:hypothetical protein